MKLMKTIKLLLLLLLFVGCSASEDQPQIETCNCTLEHYLYVPYVGGGGGTYVFQFSEPIEIGCDTIPTGYIPVSNINYNYNKINCE